MRILFVHEKFGALGGAESNAQTTGLELRRRGHEVGILHGESTAYGNGDWEGSFSPGFALNPGDSERVNRVLKEFCPDVVYVHKMADLVVIQALIESGFPSIRMVHDHDIYCMRSYKYNVFTRTVCRRPASPYCIFPCGAFLVRNRQGKWPVKWMSYLNKRREIELNKRFDRMIVVTEYMREELLRNGFNSGRIVVQAPVPPPRDAGVRSSFSERNLLIYAGQILRGKGVDVLLEALAQVKVPFQCMIFGDGNYRRICERLVGKLQLDDRVHFKGYVDQTELKENYRECSAVLLSSVWPEPIGTIGLEVMQFALPVVAFDAGGIRDWLIDGYNGYLVPWMDRAQYAARVEALLQNKECARRMGENGLRQVKQRFDFGHYITKLEKLFEEAIEEKKGRRGRMIFEGEAE